MLPDPMDVGSSVKSASRETDALLPKPTDTGTRSADASLTTGQLLQLSSAMAAIQFSYATEFAFGTPYFRLRNVSYSVLPLIWLAGPFSGFLVQPLVGHWSDRVGRRWPFIALGALFIIGGMALMASADWAGRTLFGDVCAPGPRCHATVALATVGLWVLNAAINVMQGPARALVGDLAPVSQQTQANSTITLLMGAANLAGNLLVTFSRGGIQQVLVVGMAVVALTAWPTVRAARALGDGRLARRRPSAGDGDEDEEEGAVIAPVLFDLMESIGAMYPIALPYFFSWLAFTPFQFYTTDWFGSDVYRQAGEYEKGVRMGALSFAAFSVVQVLFSIVQPAAARRGVRRLYAASQFSLGAVALLVWWLGRRVSPAMAMTLVASLGINFTVFNAIPFALIATHLPPDTRGATMALLNASCVIAQTLGNALVGVVTAAAGGVVSVGIGCIAVLSTLACLLFIPRMPSM
ncbi:hypothetical protein CDCA_CDCA01G0299 [Cyanidium caldarium]|uniref:Uncharacterized protein n=1 Tax=Cyanidium caldarium TaxID=2771 RepID=A0AAV9IQ39_CYACA|nr:hypothetical protein CDCA_CDCA01G0299 [Cyanidium caldarium]